MPEAYRAHSGLHDYPKVLIVADNASEQMGGEAILPLHYFRQLRRRRVEAWLCVHARVREELKELLPEEELRRVTFIEEAAIQTTLWRWGSRLPQRVADATATPLVRVSTALRQRTLVRRLVEEQRIDVVHQPTPVSPKEPSCIWNVGAPVIIGPMNGGMRFPPAFEDVARRSERIAMAAGRSAADVANRLLPGKVQASTLLVANRRTADALPLGLGRRATELVENGVELDLWTERPLADPAESRVFTFLGFLRDWKMVDVLLEAARRLPEGLGASVRIIGDGPERPKLEAWVREADLTDRVEFCGFVRQPKVPDLLAHSRALVLPSVYECGGAVVLEAMALGLPVIATAWGGPTDYLTEACGFLVGPSSREQLVAGVAEAMLKLLRDPELARRMGRAGRQRVEERFSWGAKIDQVLTLYERVRGARVPVE